MSVLSTLLLLWYVLEYYFDVIQTKIWGIEETEEEDVRGKVVVITGGNAGIGKSLAMKLADRGATVILGCRNMVEGKASQEEIMYETKSRKVHLFQLDLKSPSSIKRFSADVTQQFPQISVLINNAGICVDSDNLQYSHGSEMHMLINHFGHFMLTKLLLPFIQRGAPSRIVSISSSTLLFSELDPDDLMLEKHPNPTKINICPLTTLPYNNSKMANSLFAKELGRRMSGTGVTTYSVCPGLCETKIFREYSKVGQIVVKLSLILSGLSVSQAANSVLYCVLSRKCENETGKFYRFGKICASGNRKLKTEYAKKLWDATEKSSWFYNNS